MVTEAKRPRLELHSSSDAADAGLRCLAKLLLAEADVKRLAEIEELADDALAWAVAHGVVMYQVPAAKAQATAVPFTLLPTPFAANLYEDAMEMAPTFHLLMDRVSTDLSWLQGALEATGKMDVICGRLLEICTQVYGEGGKVHSQDVRLHIMRNDFMLDTQSRASGFPMKQVELNMIAASFSTHVEDVTEIHRYLLSKYLCRLEGAPAPETLSAALERALPRSPNAEGLAAALAEAHRAYEGRWQASGRLRVVLFVAEASENNELDHRKLEIELFQGHRIMSLRRSIAQLAMQKDTLLQQLEGAAQCDKESCTGSGRPSPQALVVDGHEVSVAYFRSGYWPGHFNPPEECWATRTLIEASEAVKCPSAPAQLAGMKKVQQLLCEPEQLHHFMEPQQAALLARTFATMSDPTGASEQARRCLQAAKERPEAWVLKPQVEGSGELFFDGDIPRVLESRSPRELEEFVLMERIRPPVTCSAVFGAKEGKRARVAVRASVAELGIYGVFVADGSRVLHNRAVGHLLRSKAQHTNQGGVFVGNAVVDAPLLVPPEYFWTAVSS